MMSFAVIASKADFNSAGAELLAGPEFVFRLVGAVVHASAKLSTAAHETIAWVRFFILDSSSISLLDLTGCSMPKRGHKSTWPTPEVGPSNNSGNLPPGASKQTRETHFFTEGERKPISLRSPVGVAINCRIASKTTLNCLSYLLSSSSSR